MISYHQIEACLASLRLAIALGNEDRVWFWGTRLAHYGNHYLVSYYRALKIQRTPYAISQGWCKGWWEDEKVL